MVILLSPGSDRSAPRVARSSRNLFGGTHMKRPVLLAAAAAIAALSTHAFATSIAVGEPAKGLPTRSSPRPDQHHGQEHPERTEPEIKRPLQWLVAAQNEQGGWGDGM